MKVQEKGTDRNAEVHVRAQGQINELEEYGQYVDPTDKAICCYVPVEEGQILKVGGKFNGTTISVAYDVAIDGVFRKANNYVGKSVQKQKSKHLDFDKFLFQTKDGVIETEIKVAKLGGLTATQGDGPETIGTIEMRLSVVRTFGVDHHLGDVQTYYKPEADSEDEDDINITATFKTIAPEFKMSFESDCATLDRAAATKLKRKMDAKRPGKEPWAIFRFHYRSKDSIEAKEMELTHNPKWKKLSPPYEFELEAVPVLQVGAKPAKGEDVETSTRASSPPPTLPSTPLSPAVKKQAPKFETSAQAPTEDQALKVSSPSKEKTEGADSSENTTIAAAIEDEQKPAEPATSPMEKAVEAPKPVTPDTPVVPEKRPVQAEGPASPEPKRTKLVPTVAPISRASSASSTAAPELKTPSLAEKRKELKMLKAKREQATRQQTKMDGHLKPFKQQVEEEMARINKEIEDERRGLQEQMVRLRDDASMLAEFKRTEDGN